MKKPEPKIKTSTTVRKDLKELAELYGIQLSTALEVGLEYLIGLHEGNGKEIDDKRKRLNELKERRAFSKELDIAIREIMKEYRHTVSEGEEPEDNEYLMAMIDMQADELDIPVTQILKVCKLIYIRKIRIDTIINYTKEEFLEIE